MKILFSTLFFLTAFIGFTQNNSSQMCSNGSDSLQIYVGWGNELCYQSCDGYAYTSVAYGSGNYTVDWYGPSGYLGSNYTYNALCSGTYTIIVTDNITGLTCTHNFYLQPANQIFTTQSITDAICGYCNGQIDVFATGGTPPYTYSIDGSNFSSNNSFYGLCAGAYIIQVSDTNGCISYPYTIVVNDNNSVSLDSSSITCASSTGSNDGQVNAYGSSANGIYFYELDGDTSVSGNFNNVSEGWHYLCVYDNSNCMDCDSVYVCVDSVACNINASPYLITSPTSGNCDGQLGLIISGTTTYNAYWLDCATDQIVWTTPNYYQVCSGSYYAVVEDYNTGCTDTTNCITVTDSTSGCTLTASIDSIIYPNCADSTGYFAISVYGNQGPFTYSYSPMTWGNGYTGTNGFEVYYANNDVYTVVVTDSVGCSYTLQVDLTQGSGSTIVHTVNYYDAMCGMCNGGIDVYATAGVGPYTYSIDGSNFSTSSNFYGLCPGTYITLAMDANGCVSNPYTVVIQNVSSVTLDSTSISCASSSSNNDGQVNAYGSSANGIYFYELDGDTSVSGNFNNVSEGWHYLCVYDNSNCMDCDSIYVCSDTTNCNITASPVIVANPTNGNCNGQLGVNITGTTTYNAYWLDCATNQIVWTTPNYYQVCSGSYYAVVEDYNTGCTDTTNCITISDSTFGCTLTASIDSIIYPNCADSTGYFSISVYGNQGPFTYSYSPMTWGNGYTGTNGFEVYYANNDVYTVVVTDSVGCSYTLQVDLTQGSGSNLFTSGYSGNTSCGQCNGIIQVNSTGGSAPYYYNLNGSGWGTQSSWSNLCPGTYVIETMDANGCYANTITYLIQSSTPFIVNADIIQNESSAGASDGYVQASVSGGFGNETITLDGVVGNNGFFGNLSSGYYLLCATEGFCSDCDTIWVGTDSTLNCTIDIISQVITPSTNGQCNGQLEATVTGTSTYNVAWYDCSTDSIAYTAPQWYNACPGSYYAVVYDYQTGCSDTSLCVDATDSLGCNLSYQFDSLIPSSGPTMQDGYIAVQATNGVGPYIYDLNGMQSTSGQFGNLLPGSYSLCITDTYNNCVHCDTVDIPYVNGINEWAESISAYPNPFKNELMLNSENDISGAEVLLYDMYGKLLLREVITGNSHKLNLDEGLSTGMYLLKLKFNNRESNIRLIRE